MYAFIRRYRMGAGSVDDLMRKVNQQFAHQISAGGEVPSDVSARVPAGIISYQAIDTGDGTIVTVTLFPPGGAGSGEHPPQPGRVPGGGDRHLHRRGDVVPSQ